MASEVRVHYQEELENLERRALDGLDLVAGQLTKAVEAVEHRDVELAELVVASDDVIDGRYRRSTSRSSPCSRRRPRWPPTCG
jgi:phosphate transport system protein